MENNKNKKSVKFQGDMFNFCDFIQVFVFTRNHHLNKSIVYFIVRRKVVISGKLPKKFGHKLFLSLSAQLDNV